MRILYEPQAALGGGDPQSSFRIDEQVVDVAADVHRRGFESTMAEPIDAAWTLQTDPHSSGAILGERRDARHPSGPRQPIRFIDDASGRSLPP